MINKASDSMSSNNTTDFNYRVTQYKKMVLIQEIGTNTKNNTAFEKNSISKDFKFFTSRIKIIS